MQGKQNLEMAVIRRISQVAVREKKVSELLREVLRILYTEMGLSRGTVTLRRGNQLFIEASYGLTEAEIQRGKYHLGEGVTGMVALTGQARIVPDISVDPAFLDRTRARGRGPHVAFICVPIIHEDEVIGTISIDRDMTPDADLDHDYNILEIVANLLADAVSRALSEHEERTRLLAENRRLKAELDKAAPPAELIGRCQAMKSVYAMIEQVAKSNATVLVRGASGTGKELIARAIQRLSDRADKPFVIVNSAALPENLIESELFGHEKGAFTGAANRRIGRVEAAHTGTLFLDEIGDLGLSMQVKLLRFLQERTYQRIGSNEELSSDVRIIAATSRNLEQLMSEGKFREDLFYRLNVFPIALPDLAARKSDIPPLAEHFMHKYAKIHQRAVKSISAGAMDLMVAYPWPGNVRELENCIERAVLTAGGDIIQTYSLPLQIQQPGGVAGVSESQPGEPDESLDFTGRVEALERRLICEALRRNRGNVAATARELRLTIRIIHYKIGKLNIDPTVYK